MTIRTLVIDDEPLVRSRILRVLRNDKDIELVGEYGDGVSALESIKRNLPDLIFLDVQMPGMTGVDVLRALEESKTPITVFVSAYKDYAVEAFESNAVDYILKPFGRERLEKAIARAKLRLDNSPNHNYAAQLLQALKTAQRQQQYLEWLSVPVNGRILLIETAEIDWIEADKNIVHLHSGTANYELRSTMTELESRLDPKVFLRIHRSTLVNLSKVKEIHPWFHGHHKVVLRGGQELRMSRYQSDSARVLLRGFTQ